MHFWGPLTTSAETIERFGEFATRGRNAAVVAREWSAAGFEDEDAAKWLEARCFDPEVAGALAAIGVTPGQAARKTRDGKRDYRDTIAFKVCSGDLSPRQGAARAMSSR